MGDVGQTSSIRSCTEEMFFFSRESHNCAGVAFVQGDSVDGSKLIDITITNGAAWSIEF